MLQETVDLLDLLDWLCRVPKDFKDLLDLLEEQVAPAQKDPVAPQEVAALRETRVFPALLASLASQDKREILAFPDSQAPPAFPALLV